MSLKPWREVARPHKDVPKDTFKQSEFAADISQVVTGTAPPEYQDAEKFFSRTFITEGMRLLLISVARRLAGQGGYPVIQLQTAFGGGKTHTMARTVARVAQRPLKKCAILSTTVIKACFRFAEIKFCSIRQVRGSSLKKVYGLTEHSHANKD